MQIDGIVQVTLGYSFLAAGFFHRIVHELYLLYRRVRARVLLTRTTIVLLLQKPRWGYLFDGSFTQRETLF